MRPPRLLVGLCALAPCVTEGHASASPYWRGGGGVALDRHVQYPGAGVTAGRGWPLQGSFAFEAGAALLVGIPFERAPWTTALVLWGEVGTPIVPKSDDLRLSLGAGGGVGAHFGSGPTRLVAGPLATAAVHYALGPTDLFARVLASTAPLGPGPSDWSGLLGLSLQVPR